MSLFPGETPQYAETHFKFKLPWSLLYRPWPEILFDMAFQAVPGITPKLWIVVRDADRFPVVLESAEIKIEGPDESKKREIKLDIRAEKAVEFFPIDLDGIAPGIYRILPQITVSRIKSPNGKNERRTFVRWNLPRLKPKPLLLHVLAEQPPKAPGYAAGEMHCHTHYSRDHVEFGASPAVLQQAAASVGLDFACCTDHAYDFAFAEDDYTREAWSPAPRFQALRDEITALPSGKGFPLMLAGEEVSVGNSKKENVHVTVFAPEGYIPGLGDCGRYWLENKPTLSIPQMLEMTSAHCFAAHPFQQMGILEKFIFRRGYWQSKDLHTDKQHPIRGLQFWNGIRDEGFKLGREFWIAELGKGNFLLPIGGNDAHGDLNDTTSVATPLVSLHHSRDHVFGKVRTVVKIDCHSGPRSAAIGDRIQANTSLDTIGTKSLQSDKNTIVTQETLNEAFAGENCYITDGPALWWERHEKQIVFHARNTKDFGDGFRYIRIFGRRYTPAGKLAKNEELCMESLVAAPANTDITVHIDNFAYLRAECETATGKFALTSAARLVQE